MKLPHITIEYREEETFAVGKMSPELIFGFGLHWAWVYSTMYKGHMLFGVDSGHFQTMVFLVSLAVFAATLLSYGVFLEPMRKLFTTSHQRKRNRLIGAVLMCASTLLMFFAGMSGAAGFACGLISGVLSGVGSAILLMSFGVSFSTCDVATTSICVALSFIVAMAAHGIIVEIDSLAHPAGGILCALFPFAELLCLNRCSRQLVDSIQFVMETIPLRTRSFFWRICLPSTLMGVVLGLIRDKAYSPENVQLMSSSDFAFVMLLTGAAACVVVMLAMLTQRQTPYFMFRTLMPVAAVLIAVVLTPLGDNPTFELFCMLVACLVLEECMWIMFADISQRYRISAFVVFGFGRGMQAVGTIIAFWLSTPDITPVPITDDAKMLVIIMLVLMIFAYVTLPTGAEIRSTLIRGKFCPALYEDAAAFAEHRMVPEKAAKSMAGTPAGADATKAGPVTTEDNAADKSGHRVEAHGKPVEGRGLTADGASSDAETSMSCNEPSESRAGRRDDEVGRIGPFKAKCLVVANTYLLSRKETEVLFLLAKGHNSAAIQRDLYISAGTVNTHMRNIYRKLNVHSRQELIALVESAEADQ